MEELDMHLGKRVRVTTEHEGVLERSAFVPGSYRITGDDSRRYVYHPGEIRLLTLVHPQNWPPQDGDTWKSPRGSRYLCGVNITGDWYLTPNRPGQGFIHPAYFVTGQGRQEVSQWKLVHRDEKEEGS
jgi:hypothetical protein